MARACGARSHEMLNTRNDFSFRLGCYSDFRLGGEIFDSFFFLELLLKRVRCLARTCSVTTKTFSKPNLSISGRRGTTRPVLEQLALVMMQPLPL